MNELIINDPSGDIGFVEYKRAFVVEGTINNLNLPNNALLSIKLYDSNDNEVRHVETNYKNQDIDRYYKTLTCYSEELDPNRELMSKFGFPLLIKDSNNSLTNATCKAWYSDTCYKAIIISGSDIEHGCLWNADFPLYDENNNPYDLLPIGNYLIEVCIKFDNKEYKTTKQIIIGERDNQIICRFNPLSHKNRMIEWCDEKKYAIIKDLLPGYLDTYLNKWYYHMGLLKTYRANDICLFEKTHVRMFNYLIDETSTSYATELAYLQSCNVVDDPSRLSVYYYDIGEAQINNQKAVINEFKQDEYLHVYRVDILNNLAKENTYYIDNRHVDKNITDLNNVEVKSNSQIAITGVVKPTQLDPNDFILKDDNTFEINNYPYIVKYSISIDNNIFVEERKMNMERIENESIGNSVYEFYNILSINEEWANKDINIDIDVYDYKGNKTKAHSTLKIKVI